MKRKELTLLYCTDTSKCAIHHFWFHHKMVYMCCTPRCLNVFQILIFFKCIEWKFSCVFSIFYMSMYTHMSVQSHWDNLQIDLYLSEFFE